jgi:predicted amidophosphoribosyltransferase
MPLSCPVCKADNSVAPNCRRCKADLSLLWALEDQRASLIAEARQLYELANYQEALRSVQSAIDLRDGPDTQRWLAILNVLTERFGEAWRAYESIDQHG